MTNTYDNDIWYNSLKKAPWTPPNYVFGIIWPILYVLMFISLFLITKNKKCSGFCTAIILFFIQLFFNLIWTTIFFSLKMPKLALFDLGLVIGFTLLTIKYFYKISKLSSYLLLPYITWLLLAFSLNSYIVIYN